MEFCRARLANYKCPARVQLERELPKTGTGKVGFDGAAIVESKLTVTTVTTSFLDSKIRSPERGMGWQDQGREDCQLNVELERRMATVG